MTEQDIRHIVEFVRSRQTSFSLTDENSIGKNGDYFISLYDRRSQLLDKSREYDKSTDEIYIKGAMDYFNV